MLTNKRVSFSSESGQIVLDESYLKKKVNKREFDFLAFDDNFDLIPVKNASSYEIMTTIILFDRMIKSYKFAINFPLCEPKTQGYV